METILCDTCAAGRSDTIGAILKDWDKLRDSAPDLFQACKAAHKWALLVSCEEPLPWLKDMEAAIIKAQGHHVFGDETQQPRRHTAAEEACQEAIALALKVYEEIRAPVDKTYREATAQAEEVCEKAKAQAAEACREAIAPAWKAYLKATAQAEAREKAEEKVAP